VVPAPQAPVQEAVSPRLKRRLAHPNPGGRLYGLRYSPDGRRIIAGDYPGGVIRVWDVETGEPLTTIETGQGSWHSARYFFLTADWKTIYVSRRQRRSHSIEKDGKKLARWECEGDVRTWNLDTGELRRTFKHSPPRGIVDMALAPDGSALLACEELSGEDEDGPKRGVSLWDTNTGRYRALPDSCSGQLGFSPDSKAVAIGVHDAAGYTIAVKLYDVASAREQRLIPIAEKFARAGPWIFVPDGQLLVGYIQAFPGKGIWKDWGAHLRFWDVATGREVASFSAAAKGSVFSGAAFSADGRMLADITWGGDTSEMFLIDLRVMELARAMIPNKTTMWCSPAFSPDGNWLAWSTQVIPDGLRGQELVAEDVPQPHIHLIDVSEKKVRETIVAPPGFAVSACFSPDGRTLATSGHGEVLLWDFMDLAGSHH
jgi:WD40 repeat protein